MTTVRRRRRRSSDKTAPSTVNSYPIAPQPRHPGILYTAASEENVERIHQKSMQILSEIGIAFLDDESQDILRANGVKVVDDIAYFDPAHVEELIAQAPSKFTLRARDPEKSVVIGEDYIAFSPVAGPPFTYDIDRGRRESTMADFVNFLKLTHMTPYLHFGGGIISEPNDIPVPERHLDVAYAQAKYIDRSHFGSSISADAANDAIQVARLVHGDAFDDGDPRLMIIVNVSSPRRLDERMLASLTVNARAGQAVVITPFILSGAMGPVSIAGTLAQLNAEALAGLAFVQMVNPGCPVVYGSFQAVIDLQSGAPVFGAPESQLSALVSIQLARRYGLPFRGSGMYTSSKVPDAQSAYESAMAMLPGLYSGTITCSTPPDGWKQG